MKFLILPFLGEILSNLFVRMNILAITIQQTCSYKTLLVWNIWQNVSQTFHKTPSCGPGSQLWLANGRGLYLTPTTEFPTWCVEGVSAQSHLTTSTLKHQIVFNQILKKLSGGNCYTIDTHTHIFMKKLISITIQLFYSWIVFEIDILVWFTWNNWNQDAI